MKAFRRMTGLWRYYLPALFALALLKANGQTISRLDMMYMDSLMNKNYAWNEPGAVALVAVDGKPIFRRAYGLANIELFAQNRPEYLFPIGSLTKQFTAVSVLQLAQAGLLSLEDDIRRYIPWYNTHGRTITIHQLLSHTSGIISFTERKDFIANMMFHQSKYDIAKFFMEDSLLFEPGTDWSYSNSGYFLAGMVVEKVTGMTLADYMEKNIFKPLGMMNTYVATGQSLLPLSATGYSALGSRKFKKAAYFSWTWLFASADMVSNVDDLLKWDEALYTEKILDRKWLEGLWTSIVLPDGMETNYGYGFSVGNYEGTELISHGGGIYGFMSYAIRIPSKHIYVVLLSNKTVNSPTSTAYHMAFRMAGKQLSPNKVLKNYGMSLDDYVGVYAMERVGTRIAKNYNEHQMYRYITTRNDSLFSQTTGDSQFALLPVDTDVFALGSSKSFLRFHRNPDNTISSLELFSEPLNFGPVQIENKTVLPLPSPRSHIMVDSTVLKRYEGNYDFGDGYFLMVSVEGNRIFIEDTGRPKEEIFAESENRFFLRTADITLEFIYNSIGMVNGLIMNQFGEYKATKIE